MLTLPLTANGGLRQAAFEKQWTWQTSADTKYAMGKKIDVFAEYFSQYANHAHPLHSINGGILFHVGNL